jgi:hypothetical protein
VSSQHDEAPARPDESGPAGGAEQSTGSIAAGHEPASPVTFDPESTGPEVASAISYGHTTPSGAKASRSTPWKTTADGRTIFRRGTPFVVWWAWVAFAIFNIAQIAIPDHDYFSLELTAGLLAVTAVMYACTLRPRVLTDSDGVRVYNPYREHRIRWGALSGVYLGDSVELCSARSEPKKDKTIYCWALYSGRRTRLKARLRSERERSRMYGDRTARRAEADAQELARQDIVQLMAAEIGRRSTDAKQRGVPAAVLESTWAWWPLAYVLVPAALLLGLLLGR